MPKLGTVSLRMSITALGALLMFLYVLFGWPSSSGQAYKKRKKKGYIPGLRNLGNSCFLNAIIQALASSVMVSSWLESQKRQKLGSNLGSALLELLKVMDGHDSEDTCAAGVLKALHLHGWVISSEEQDAHELFQIVVSTLTEEKHKESAEYGLNLLWLKSSLLSNVRPNIVTKIDYCNLQENLFLEDCDDKSLRQWDYNILRHNSDVNKFSSDIPFIGYFAAQLQCVICHKKKPVQWTSFISLSLPLPAYSWQFSLSELLHLFVSEEVLKDVICENCSNNKEPYVYTDFMKRVAVGKAPLCLCIHIQRTMWQQNGFPAKRRDRVTFTETLSLAPFSCSSLFLNTADTLETPPIQDTADNALFSMLSSRFSATELWFYTSDLNVKEVTVEEVLRAEAYMLLYEKLC